MSHMSHCTQPTMYKFFYFKIEIKTKVDSYMPCKAMAHSTKSACSTNNKVQHASGYLFSSNSSNTYHGHRSDNFGCSLISYILDI